MTDIFKEIINKSDVKYLTNFISYFWFTHGYSVYNCMLIYAQRPGAVLLATEKQWEKYYSRFVRNDVTPIVIMKPFGPIEFIYDYSDTYGDTEIFPKDVYDYRNENIKDWWVDEMVNSLGFHGILYLEKNFGTIQHGELRILEKPFEYEYYLKNGDKKKIKTDCCITLNPQKSKHTKFLSIIHELGHLFCGHLKRGEYTPKALKFDERNELSNYQIEAEAEFVTEMVLGVLGVEYDPTSYLDGYNAAEENKINYTELIKVIDNVLKLVPKCIGGKWEP